MRRDPVTDKMVKYFSFAQRLRRYFVSFAVMLVMVALAVLTMIVSLNLNGYVTMEKSPIYIRFLASFAAPVRSSLFNRFAVFSHLFLREDYLLSTVPTTVGLSRRLDIRFS